MTELTLIAEHLGRFHKTSSTKISMVENLALSFISNINEKNYLAKIKINDPQTKEEIYVAEVTPDIKNVPENDMTDAGLDFMLKAPLECLDENVRVALLDFRKKYRSTTPVMIEHRRLEHPEKEMYEIYLHF